MSLSSIISAIRLPGLAALLAGIRLVLTEIVSELRKAAAAVPTDDLKAALLGAADKIQSVLDSTELATIAVAALAETKDAILTGKGAIVHRPDDLL